MRVRDGETQVTDGPYAETREQLGGYYMIECDTLDQAIDAARRIPSADQGSVEVRPIREMRLTADGRDAVARASARSTGGRWRVLARALGDIDRAEDALQEAGGRRLGPVGARRRRRTRRGLDSLTTARNRAIDRLRESTPAGSEAARARQDQEAADATPRSPTSRRSPTSGSP